MIIIIIDEKREIMCMCVYVKFYRKNKCLSYMCKWLIDCFMMLRYFGVGSTMINEDLVIMIILSIVNLI